MDMRRSIDDVVETVRMAKARDRKSTLLVGAGCSVKAGVPTAAGFVKHIQERFPRAYERADEKTYAKCMGEWAAAERGDLIAEFVDAARINWAHICIAQLMQEGFVDRVLTTNFDLLVVRACALLGLYPAVYDFAASQLFKPADLPDQAVFYLHGQRTGFVLMNTDEECERHTQLLAPVFTDAGRGRVWLVIGYSGENDPVFDHLAQVERFENNLYWIGYQDSEPARHVRERLLCDGKYAFYVNGFDADDFFVTLAQKLGHFPPDFVGKPFDYLDSLLETVTPFSQPGQSGDVNVLEAARREIRAAAVARKEGADGEPAKSEEPSAAAVAQAAWKDLLAGDIQSALRLSGPNAAGDAPDLKLVTSWALVFAGNRYLTQARTQSGDAPDALFAQAMENYSRAVAIKPDMHEALNNWGCALSDQAKSRTGDAADALWAQAAEKYSQALAVKPDNHDVLYNWGKALGNQAKRKSGDAADALFDMAGEKFSQALAIRPDMYDALASWADVLSDQGRSKSGAAGDALFAQAGEKYAQALAIRPDMHEALNNWGNALSAQAERKSGEAADALFAQAGEKYAQALGIKPDKPEALYNWGHALSNQAKSKSGEEAEALFAQAGEKYAQALAIKSDMQPALTNWGFVLMEQGKRKDGGDRTRLFTEAEDKLSRAESLKTGSGAYNLACLSALRGEEEECRKWLEVSKAERTLPKPEVVAKDTDLTGVCERGWFREFLEG